MIDPAVWPELREARKAADQAREAWRAAQLAYWRAPPGKRRVRAEALKAATRACLQADMQLAATAFQAGVR